MTAPVEIDGKDENRIRPKGYSAETTPQPTDDALGLARIPERTLDVWRFPRWAEHERAVLVEVERSVSKNGVSDQ